MRSVSGHLFPASGDEVDDNSLSRGLELYDETLKSEGLLNEKLAEVDERRQEILKFFFEMKKTLWKVGLMTEDVGNYNQAMIEFLKTSADFDMLKVEFAKPLEEVRKAKEFILNRKMSVLGKEIYKVEGMK